MDVLDILEHHVHRNVAQLKLRDHQYSGCALMIAKMRSTSSTSLPRSGSIAALMVFSFA
jgi:hypothetical protein